MKIIAINNNRGFTLIEAMVSLFVVSIGLLAITRMQVTSINGNTKAVNSINAVLESSSTIEQMLSISFQKPELAPTGIGTTVDSNLPQADSRFSTNYSVNQVGVGTDQSFSQITLTTTWIENGVQKSLQTEFFRIPDNVRIF